MTAASEKHSGSRPERRRWGLLPRLVVAFISVGLVPLAWLSYQLVGINQDALTEQVLRTHTVAADAAASRIHAELESRRAFLSSAGAEIGRRLAESESLAQSLPRLLEDGAGLGAVVLAVVDGQGREVVRAQRELGPSGASDLLIALGTGSEAFLEADDTSWLVARTELGSTGAALVAMFDTVETSRSLHPVELGPDASVYLVHGREVLLGSGQETEPIPERLLELASTRHLSGSGRYDGEGRSYLGAFAPILESPWYVVSLQSTAAAEQVRRAMHLRSSAAIGLASVVVLLLSAGAFRTVIRPLRAILAEKERLLGESESRGGDEVAQLESAFDALARHVTENEALEQVFLGRYQVLEVVGEGAMGSVFMGWDPSLRRPVALKTIKVAGKAHRPNGADELLSEAVTIAKLDHPNIVQVHDVGETPGAHFIAMEYVRGSSLREHLRAGEPLPIPLVIHVCRAVAEALSAAHDHGVLHNDIKPGNILLREDGQTKITDFGISHAMGQLGEADEILFGTPGYLAPETISGEGRDERADLFALGVTAYECLIGSKPFGGKSVAAILGSTVLKDPPAPKVMRDQVPDELNDLVVELLRKDPEQRLSSAAEAAERLSKLADRFPWAPSGAMPDTVRVGAETLSSLVPTRLVDSVRARTQIFLETGRTLPMDEMSSLFEGDEA